MKVDVAVLALGWIGVCGAVWSLVHGRILWLQWRDQGMRPGPLGFGLWVQFSAMALVVAAVFTRRVWPGHASVRMAGEFALVAVALAMTWLTGQLVRRWIRMCPRCARVRDRWKNRQGRL